MHLVISSVFLTDNRFECGPERATSPFTTDQIYGVPQVQKLHLRSQTSDLRPQTSDLRSQTSDLRPQTTIYVYFCPSFLDHTYKVDG